MDVVRDSLNDWVESVSPGTFLGMHYDHPLRVFLVLYTILYIGGFVSYFGITGIHYTLVYKLFPKQLLRPEDAPIAPGQIRHEISIAVNSMPWMVLLTAPIYWLQWCGYSRVYTDVDQYGWLYLVLSIPLFLMFTDFGVYWIHRGLHWGPFYKHLHKTHHLFLSPSPWAAIAFNPIDGWLQSTPYHIFVFIFPFHHWVYLIMFVFVQIWTISIHDRVSIAPLDNFLNGSAHHAGHHYYFNYNYGQYFTLWDRIGGTHKPWDGGKFKFTTDDSKKKAK